MLFSQMDSFRHHTNVLFPLGMDVEGYNDMNLFRIITISFLHRENLLALKVSCSRLGRVNLCHWAGQDVLVKEQEVGIFASLDAASLILNEHLLGTVDGQGSEGLLTSSEFLWPPRRAIL